MATTLTVERIDILEGPNLESMLYAFAHTTDELSAKLSFNNVVYFDDSHREIVDYTRRIFSPMLVGIRYLGYRVTHPKTRDFIITVTIMDTTFKGHYNSHIRTFEGHYNTHTRKGSLRAVE